MSGLPRLTEDLENAIRTAFHYANQKRHEWVSTEHFFWALLHDPLTARAVQRCGGDLEQLKSSADAFVEAHSEALPEGFELRTGLTVGVEKVIKSALLHAQSSERDSANCLNVLIAFYELEDKSTIFGRSMSLALF